ncbi:MAG: hypothetical protein ACLPVY_14580 [Acidimicrobiia bacterium]
MRARVGLQMFVRRVVVVVYAARAGGFGQSPGAADMFGGDGRVVVGRDWNARKHLLTNLPRMRRSPRTPVPSTSTTQLRPTTTTTVDGRFLPVSPTTGGVLVGCPKRCDRRQRQFFTDP